MSITAPASMETLYNYVPSFGFNLIAVLAYSFVLAAHGFWFIKYQRTRWIQAHMLAFTATGIAVYTVRLSSYVYSDQPKLWLPQFILGMFSPTWLIIGMLLALSKAYKYSSDGRVAIINRPKLIPMLLVGYQAVIGLLLIISSLFTGNNRLVPTAIFSGDSGNQLLIASLANQVIILTLIQALITWTAITLRRPNTDSSSPISRCFLALMFFTVGMVWVRSIFRLVETAQGWSGMAARSETYFGLFEFAQMFGAAAVWAVVPFAKVCDRLQEDKYVDMDLAKGRTDDGDAESVISGKHAIV